MASFRAIKVGKTDFKMTPPTSKTLNESTYTIVPSKATKISEVAAQ
jgi:hypothetical protein